MKIKFKYFYFENKGVTDRFVGEVFGSKWSESKTR